jgi:FlaA1/EpsC-like NDP-sugar epimerase
MLDAAATAAMTATGDRPPIERRRRLTPAALAVTNQKVSRAYSPIVIAGAVRLVDFVVLSLIGIALYFAYVVRLSGFHWEFVAAIVGMTVTAVICFQAADIYEVQVFRGQLRQMSRMISSWAFVFLLFIGASFLVKLGSEISRLWLSAFFFIGLAALVTERVFLRAGPARPPHHRGRLGPERRTAGRGAQDPARL